MERHVTRNEANNCLTTSAGFRLTMNATHLFLVACFTFLQGFDPKGMKAWRVHWDRQLYKALEHQYQMGLEALNENLPEIKIDLVFQYVVNTIDSYL